MPNWAWDNRAGRYRDLSNGRFMSSTTVRAFVDDSLEASRNNSAVISQMYSEGEISASTWRVLMRQEIKREVIRQYVLGIGGLDRMTARDWGSVGGIVADQYRYLEGFYNEVDAGNLSGAQIAQRAKMYSSSAREAYERANERVARSTGAAEERWRTTATESCPDCLEREGQGWQPIGTFSSPGDGSTQCLTNCQCFKEYR